MSKTLIWEMIETSGTTEVDEEEYILLLGILVELKIIHIVDPMHIEKNVCDNLVRMTLPIEGKSKETMKTCIGMQPIQIRSNLWPT